MKKQKKELPVYLFTGFLESGKTKFIQETMEDPRFNAGERTLMLICEEGIEEFDPSTFAAHNVYIETVDSEEELTEAYLAELAASTRCDRVVVEYNGMWLLDTLYMNMPENWTIYQEVTFVDATTFTSYNLNMRQLMADKLKSSDLVAFNRVTVGADIMEYHKAVRMLSTRAQILYEFEDGTIQPDDIEDPLPFDKDADIIEIEDDHYAVWYRDMTENMDDYNGKTIRVKGITAVSDRMVDGTFVFGRYVMTCCAEDIQFAGCVTLKSTRFPVLNACWVILTARVDMRWHEAYGEVGPVLTIQGIEPADAPEEEVATF